MPVKLFFMTGWSGRLDAGAKKIVGEVEGGGLDVEQVAEEAKYLEYSGGQLLNVCPLMGCPGEWPARILALGNRVLSAS